MTVLGYFEDTLEADVPSEAIWHHPRRLKEWFETVKRRHENPEMQAIPDDGDMTTNRLVQDLMGDGNA